jgi:hypothetical protein
MDNAPEPKKRRMGFKKAPPKIGPFGVSCPIFSHIHFFLFALVRDKTQKDGI